MSPKLAISIINYRTADLTMACLRSVLDDLGPLDARVIVTDNASGDGSADQIADWIAAQPDGERVRLVRSERNTGFAGGHNIGMAAAPEAEFYLILNSDALLTPGFLTTILTAAEANPKAGLFAPSIGWEDGRIQTSCFRFHSPLGELDRAARNGLITRLLKNHVVALGPDPDPGRIEWASFASILLRGTMVRELGPMDEGYFLYYEDAEYCLRARRAGWPIAYVPKARAVHFRGGSGPVKKLAHERKRLPPYYYASRSRFLRQAHGHSGLIASNLLWHLGRGIAWVARYTGGSYSPMAAQEGADIWINSTRPLGPRLAPGETR
jgi:N-acetylglucosaminyl-diphospho-decaprenol L-rhamnosyltransferase